MGSLIQHKQFKTKKNQKKQKISLNTGRKEDLIMTLVLSNKKEINAIGTQTNRNCKPVFCITTGEIFASVTEAAKANNVHISSVTGAMTGKSKTVNGKRFCLLSKCAEHMDEISEAMQTRYTKSIAYDTMVARQKAVEDAHNKCKKAQETVRARKEALKALQIKCVAEEVKLRDAERMLAEAEAEVKKLQN
jgi:hypothetical protein